MVRTDARRTPLQTPYTGPYAVIDSNDKFFTLQMGNKQDTVSIDRLKEALVEEDGSPVPVAQPPKRGRPPLQTPSPNAADPLPVAAGLNDAHQSSPSPTPTPTPSPTPPTTPSVSGRPTYAEVTTRGGRNT